MSTDYELELDAILDYYRGNPPMTFETYFAMQFCRHFNGAYASVVRRDNVCPGYIDLVALVNDTTYVCTCIDPNDSGMGDGYLFIPETMVDAHGMPTVDDATFDANAIIFNTPEEPLS